MPSSTASVSASGGRLSSEHRMGPVSRLTYLQADNQLKTFAKVTGGQSLVPPLAGRPSRHPATGPGLSSGTSTAWATFRPMPSGTENSARSRWRSLTRTGIASRKSRREPVPATTPSRVDLKKNRNLTVYRQGAGLLQYAGWRGTPPVPARNLLSQDPSLH